METSKEWTVFWCVFLLVVGTVCINITNKVADNTKIFISNGYTRTTLPGAEGFTWVKSQ